MADLPGLLSLVIFLPALGALLLLALPSVDSIRWAALTTTVVTFVLSVGLWLGFDAAVPTAQAPQLATRLAWFGPAIDISVLRRRRRAEPAAPAPHDAAGPDCRAVVVDLHRQGAQGLLRAAAAAGDRRLGRVRRLRRLPVLHLFRAHAHPDGVHHRHLGRGGPDLRGRQVRDLHVGRVAPDARRRAVARVPGRRRRQRRRVHDRLVQAGPVRRAAERPGLAVRAVRARVHDQGAAVPAPHLAPRRPTPRRRPAARWCWRACCSRWGRTGLLRFVVPFFPNASATFRHADRDPGRRRDRLRSPRGVRPDRHQKARRVLVPSRTSGSWCSACSRSTWSRCRAR